MDPKWSKRFELVRIFGWIFLAGCAVCLCAIPLPESYRIWPLVMGVVLCLPGFVYTYVVTIWHWKERYRGTHSDLWGAILLIETSGWFKLVYFFRHLLPDVRQRGRYRVYKTLPDVF